MRKIVNLNKIIINLKYMKINLARLKRKLYLPFYISAALLVIIFLVTSSFSYSQEELCPVDVDVTVVMDVSGSMAEGASPSVCHWWEFVYIDPSWQWIEHYDYDVTEQWCTEHSHPTHPSEYTPATNSKIEDAKVAANLFLDNLGTEDQSALVSFSTTAQLEKELSSDHAATQAEVNALTVFGATNIGDAIDEAIVELTSPRVNPQANKIAILLTDGKANKPHGSGSGEDPADVQYAKDKADEAATYNIKIFTIGLGDPSDVNSVMLQYIADVTGAEYHYAPTSEELQVIYDQISQEICEYGSISGCKYEDSNNDSDISGETTLVDWEIVLQDVTGAIIDTQLTDNDGCYTFPGLEDGDYVVTETLSGDWIQTYPAAYEYTLNITGNTNIEDIHFGNYLPICGNGIIDELVGEECDDGNIQDGDGCSSICQIEISEFCELALTKSDIGYDPVYPGEQVVYHLSLENIGGADCTGEGVVLQDLFDQNTQYLSAGIQPSTTTTEYLEWNFGTMIPGDTAELDLTMQVSGQTPCDSTLVNQARFWSEQTAWGEYVIEETSVICEPEIPDICGVKYHDLNQNGVFDGDDYNLADWQISLWPKAQCEQGNEWADEVVSFNQGLASDDNSVAPEYSDPNQALGVAEDDETINFVSLGLNGELILSFENLIENGIGDDIEVRETTYGNPSCNDYPEQVQLYASQDGVNWEDLGIGCLDATFDLGSLAWAQYVKLVDQTNLSDFDGLVDGYDVDGVRAIHCLELGEEVTTLTTTSEGYCFENLDYGYYQVCEELKEDWINITPLCQQVLIADNSEEVNFGNYYEGPGVINEPPIAYDDEYTTNENETLNVNGVLDNDDDPDDYPTALIAVLVGDVTHGSLSLNSDGSFSYTPETDYVGVDNFTYKAFDGEDYSNVATATITINEVNNGGPSGGGGIPFFPDISNPTVEEPEVIEPEVLGVKIEDEEPEVLGFKTLPATGVDFSFFSYISKLAVNFLSIFIGI